MTGSLREQFPSFRGIVEGLWKVTIIQLNTACTLDMKLSQIKPSPEKILTHFPQPGKQAVLKENPSCETETFLRELG